MNSRPTLGSWELVERVKQDNFISQGVHRLPLISQKQDGNISPEIRDGDRVLIAPWVWVSNKEVIPHIWIPAAYEAATNKFKLDDTSSAFVDRSTGMFDIHISDKLLKEICDQVRTLNQFIGIVTRTCSQSYGIDLARPKFPWKLEESVLIATGSVKFSEGHQDLPISLDRKVSRLENIKSAITPALISKEMESAISELEGTNQGVVAISAAKGPTQHELISQMLACGVVNIESEAQSGHCKQIIISENDSGWTRPKFNDRTEMHTFAKPWATSALNSICHFDSPDQLKVEGTATDWATYGSNLLDIDRLIYDAEHWLSKSEEAFEMDFESLSDAVNFLKNDVEREWTIWHTLQYDELPILFRMRGMFGAEFDFKNELALQTIKLNNLNLQARGIRKIIRETRQFVSELVRHDHGHNPTRDVRDAGAIFLEELIRIENRVSDCRSIFDSRKMMYDTCQRIYRKLQMASGSDRGGSVSDLIDLVRFKIQTESRERLYLRRSRFREGLSILKGFELAHLGRSLSSNFFTAGADVQGLFSILNPNISISPTCYIEVCRQSSAQVVECCESLILINPSEMRVGLPSKVLGGRKKIVVVDDPQAPKRSDMGDVVAGVLEDYRDTTRIEVNETKESALSRAATRKEGDLRNEDIVINSKLSFTAKPQPHRVVGGMVQNLSEVEVLIEWVQKYHAVLMKKPGKVAIVSPFKGQIEKLKAALSSPSFIVIDLPENVDAAEYDYVFFSCTLTSNFGANEDFKYAVDRVANGISSILNRAKRFVHILYDSDLFLQSGNPILFALIRYAVANATSKLPQFGSMRSITHVEAERTYLSTIIDHDEVLEKILEEAEKEVVIHSFKCDFPLPGRPMIHEWINKATERGVNVVLIIGYDGNANKESIIKAVAEYTPNVKLLMHRKHHSKTIIADEKVKVLGSFNWLNSFGDDFILIDDSEVTKYKLPSEDVRQHRATAFARPLEEIDVAKAVEEVAKALEAKPPRIFNGKVVAPVPARPSNPPKKYK